MWVLQTDEHGTQHTAFYKSYDYRYAKVVHCDSRAEAQSFPSRTAAEGVAEFHGLDGYKAATIWG